MQEIRQLQRNIRYGTLGISAGIVAAAWFVNLYCITCAIDWSQIPLWPVLLISSYIGGTLVGEQTQKWALALIGGAIGALVGSYILISFVIDKFQ